MKFSPAPRLPSSLLLGATLCLSHPAHALSNGGFEQDLEGWSSVGDAAVRQGGLDGDGRSPNVLVLTTASLPFQDDFPLAAGALNVSGQSAADNWDGALEEAAGLAAGGLDQDAGPVYEGSVAWQTLTVHAGDRLSLRFKLLTADAALPDIAFIAFNGQAFTLASAAQALLPTGAAHYLGQTAWTDWQHTFSFDATVRVALGMGDVGDASGTSALLIDDVALTPAVPEPAVPLLALCGALLAGVLSRAPRGANTASPAGHARAG